MGRGKKKVAGSKGQGEGDLPKVGELSLDSTPSTSTTEAAAPPPAEPTPAAPTPAAPTPAKPPVVEEEDDGDGLGLGASKKRKPRKKKPAAGQQPSSEQGGPSKQTGPPPGLSGPWKTVPAPGLSGPGPTGPPPGFPGQPGQSRPTSAESGSSSSTPGQPWAKSPSPGQDEPKSLAPGQPWQTAGVGSGSSSGTTPRQQATPFTATTPVAQASSQQSTSVVPAKPSRGDIMCRFKIPDKVLGRSVRATPIQVLTNYLPMTIKPLKVYRYDVTFKPDRPKKMLTAVFKLVESKYYPKDYIAFDQSKNCYCFAPLKNVPTDGGRFTVNVEIKDVNDRLMSFEVSFKPTGVVDLANIIRHMQTGGSTLNMPSEEIQCIDVILRQGALESYVKCGRQFFKRPDRPINLTGGMEMWTGLFQSAIFTTRAFINIDVAHKGFPIHQSMISAMENSFRLKTNCPVEDQHPASVETFKNYLKNLRVVARMVGPPNDGQTREFICNGIVGTPEKLYFTIKKGDKESKMSVYEYFTKEKKYRFKYPKLNCLWVGPKDKKIYYPMELLEVAYGQPLNRQLNDMQLSNMVRQAATPPDDRKRKIDEVARHMNYSNNKFFKQFGLEISNEFFEVTAKVLQAPQLQVGEARPETPRRGVWQARKLLKPESLFSWGFIAIETDCAKSNYETIKHLLTETGRQLGMKIAEPKMIQFQVKMREFRSILLRAVDENIKFMFVIVSSWGRDIYHKVKQIAECDVGILTQCIKENTAANKMNQQTMKNILLKVNSKLMGINQSLDATSVPRCIKDGPVMIVGADVTHPSPDQSNIPSIAAITASMDPKCFIYNIELSIQTPKKEMIVQFEDMLFDHLVLFRKRNNMLPKKIYIFRDGVSEGQFAEVMNSELTAVHRAYVRLCQTFKPEVMFLLVQKRHHTRFFLGNKIAANVEPGTVVDTHIVHPKELDFYLVSHQAIKGTARPTRYHAVCNSGGVAHDEVEQLTYYLCHLYARCARSVSYPTPTYYAHLACMRARSLTHGQQFDNKLLERQPQRLRVLDRMLEYSRMFFV